MIYLKPRKLRISVSTQNTTLKALHTTSGQFILKKKIYFR